MKRIREPERLRFKGVDQTPAQFTRQGVFSLFVFALLLGLGVFGAMFLSFSFWMVGAAVIFVPLLVYISITSDYVKESFAAAVETLGATVEKIGGMGRGAEPVEQRDAHEHFAEESLKPKKKRRKFDKIVFSMVDSGKQILSDTDTSNQKLIEEGKTEFLDSQKDHIKDFQKAKEKTAKAEKLSEFKKRRNFQPQTDYKKDFEEENFQYEPEMWKQD